MKKAYQKPILFCEDLRPEEMLCGCAIQNPNMNEEWHCGFVPDGLDIPLFAQGWNDCVIKEGDIPSLVYCYHSGTVNLFGS